MINLVSRSKSENNENHIFEPFPEKNSIFSFNRFFHHYVADTIYAKTTLNGKNTNVNERNTQ